MRNPRIAIGLSIAAFLFAAAFSQASPVAVSVSVFHDQLAPHGRWVGAASYGDVWVPSGVVSGWQPYVEGEWVYSDYGWTWVSDDPWGDVPYHYGTWAWVEPYGWVWIPGTIWAPAWVTWAYTDDYIGWAPVPPSFVLSANGYFGSPVVVVATRYVFVPAPRFVGVRVSTVRVAPQQNVTIFPQATKTTRYQVSNGIVRTAGPPRERIEKAVGHPVERVPVSRIRTQPTSLAAAGVTHAKSIRVVAPERERKAEAAGAKTAPRAEAPKASQKAEAPKAASQESKKEQPARARESSQGHVKPETASAPARSSSHSAAAPSGPSKKSVASEKPQAHSNTTAERPKATAQNPEKHQGAEREKAPTARPPSEPKAQGEAAPPHGSSAEQRPPKPPPAKTAANKPSPKEPPADHPHD